MKPVIVPAPSERWRRVFDRIVARCIVDPDTGCWIWTGPRGGGRNGKYPRMCLDGCTVAVHRVMYILLNGFIAPKRHVDHKCRNTACVNPDHLESVTHKENQRRRRMSFRGMAR